MNKHHNLSQPITKKMNEIFLLLDVSIFINFSKFDTSRNTKMNEIFVLLDVSNLGRITLQMKGQD
jgi:Ca2+-binding EF-hand superfamily protein